MRTLTKLITLAAVAFASLTACQTEKLDGTVQDEAVTVNIGVQAENNVQTKAGETTLKQIPGYHLRYILEVWTQGSKPECYTRMILPADENNKASFTMTLLAGRELDFLLWADYVRDELEDDIDLHYKTTDGLKQVTKLNASAGIRESKNPEVSYTRDAFFAHEKMTVTPSFGTKEITLTRAVAQLNIYTMDYLAVNEGFRPAYTSIAMPNAAAGFNVLTGMPYGSVEKDPTASVAINTVEEQFSYESNGTAVNAVRNKVFTGYYFTSSNGKNVVNFDVNFYREDGAAVTTYKMENIPMQQNYRTNITGRLLTNSATLNVEVNPAFNAPDDNLTVPPTLQAEDGIYYSIDGSTAWTKWEDKVMPDGDYTSFAVLTQGTGKLTAEHLTAIASKAGLEVIDLSKSIYNGTNFANNRFKDNKTLRKFSYPTNIKGVAAYTFQNCSSLSDVTLVEGMTDIGAGSFQGCTSLTNIVLPKDIAVNQYAFAGCTNLKTINIANIREYKTSNAARSGSAFNGCTNLAIEVTFPKGTTEILNGTFYNCASIKSVILPNSMTTIGNGAFGGCTSLLTIYHREDPTNTKEAKVEGLPEGITTINAGAFEKTAISTIAIPQGVTSIAGQLFRTCSELSSITIGEHITSIGSEAFRQTALTNVTIPGSVTSFSSVAFANIQTLTEAKIEEGDTDLTFGLGFFYECKNMEKVTFPSNTKEFKNRVLWGCLNLKDIYCYATTAPKVMFEDFGNINTTGTVLYTGFNLPDGSKKLHIPAGSRESYEAELQADGVTENYWKTVLIDKLGYEIVEDAN